jgi:hypothetical protein
MLILFWLLGIMVPLVSFQQSFPTELAQKREYVLVSIGKKKLQAIERAINEIEIKRITQLLTIDGLGKKTVIKLDQILGTRFGYDFEQETCENRE